ncbi:CmpA/NrtA family ABC transporter substrate-binding protein [Pseudoalteromonas haloplanktis]|uniref:CmpA/NrtA family ABC transporter substrate-binding protein n=1 Tax=Pseudoalteromonas haloplanktis TaxID=228 RepID=A0ABU1BAB4_PSEHA|nr:MULTISPECIES: CmpA/NrtA family ABC transporter substrate-binding protein [Pseudoalteromonas]MDQ9091431.1 CmpA/NrtA family ABC transporter substrate-binding protein [Pseudoalteromonas haloplanktis]
MISNIEKKELTLGFMPLTDSAPVVVAYEMGFFAKWGLTVTLSKQNSWATLRDKLHTGVIDAAQMLAPMPIASNLGLYGERSTVITPLILSRNGNGITISSSLYNKILAQHQVTQLPMPFEANILKHEIAQRALINEKLTFAVVFPYSCHYYQLTDWLKRSDIAVSEINLLIVPPSNMVPSLQSGDLDGFCVGGPWNAKAVREAVGVTGVTSADLLQDIPEKVLGLMASWQQQYPNTTKALICALYEACQWLESIPNRFEAARLLTRAKYLDTPIDVIAPSLLGSCLTFNNHPPRLVPSYNQFSDLNNTDFNAPESHYGEKIADMMLNNGHISSEQRAQLDIATIYRKDLFQHK